MLIEICKNLLTIASFINANGFSVVFWNNGLFEGSKTTIEEFAYVFNVLLL